jgi:hypothetical protein
VLRSAAAAHTLAEVAHRSNPELMASDAPIAPAAASSVELDSALRRSSATVEENAYSLQWARQRSCSIVKEESEEELATMVAGAVGAGGGHGSRHGSRRSSRATSPSTSLLGLSARVSPAAIQVQSSYHLHTYRTSSGIA